jgi:rod shape-determining protein MreD
LNIELRNVMRWVLVVSAAVVLQVGLLTDLRVYGVHPDLLLLVAVCAGIEGGPGRGAGIGFACGLLFDLFLQGPFGVTALAYALTGYAAGLAGDTVVRPARWISIGMVAVASAAGTLLYAALGQLLGQRSLSDPHLGAIVGIVAATNALLALPALAVCRWADHDPVRARLR